MYNIHMLVDDELDNMITKSQLSKKFPNKVDIKFGLDANKVNGVDNFPIYNATDGFKSNARNNVDSFMFTSRQTKYDVPGQKHTSVGEIQPYLYNKHGVSRPTESNIRMQPGVMSSLYGLPPDRDIILENPTAQAMNLMGGKMTEEKLRNHIYRKEEAGTASETPGDFFSDPRVTAFMDDSVPMQETTEAERVEKTSRPEPMHETTEPAKVKKTSRPTPRQEDDIFVEPAFEKGIPTEPENKKKSSRTEDDGIVAEPTTKKKKSQTEFNIQRGGREEFEEIDKLLNQLKDEPNGKYRNIHKEISSKMVALGFIKPDAKIQINKMFVQRVKTIMEDVYMNRGRDLTKKQERTLNYLLAQGNRHYSANKPGIKVSDIDIDMHFEKDS